MNDIILTGTGLLLAHFISDFILQTRGMIHDKREKGWKSPALAIHALTAALLAVVLAWEWEHWLVIGITTLSTHWLIDVVKMRSESFKSVRAFLLDQLAHVLVIVFLLFYLYPQLAILFVLHQDVVATWPVYLLGLLLLYRPTGFLIEHAIAKWAFDPAANTDDSLPEAGKWIGYLERLLIFIFMLMGEYSAIGFLIAAKSILRFRDHAQQQKQTEYILLGTLLSFTLAILVSLFVKYLIGGM